MTNQNRIFNWFRHNLLQFGRIHIRQQTCVMAFLDHTVRSTTEIQHPGLFAEIAEFWRQFIIAAFDPYRPEQYYMRGPGPAWRAKHGSERDSNPAGPAARPQ